MKSNSGREKKVKVEVCVGLLQRIYDPDDQYLLFKTRKVSSAVLPLDKGWHDLCDLIIKREREGWTILNPAYPRTLLAIPWKNILKVKLS